MKKPKILITPTSLCKNTAFLEKISQKADTVINTKGRPLSEDELVPLVGDIDGYLAGLDDITGNVIRNAKKLRVISRYGVGFERVDISEAGKRGIVVTNTPGANTQSVADLAFSLILASARMIPALNSDVKSGGWSRKNGREIYKKTLGIIGLGAIGKALAVRAKGFDMCVVAYDPFVDVTWAESNGIRISALDELIRESDIISLHVPHNEQTHNIINRERIAAMKDGVIIINTSRGGLIDEDAAADYVESGKIYGMGIDAFEAEPPRPHRLYSFENVITTPHSGAHTGEAVEAMMQMSTDNLFAVLEGRHDSEKYIVNKKYLNKTDCEKQI